MRQTVARIVAIIIAIGLVTIDGAKPARNTARPAR